MRERKRGTHQRDEEKEKEKKVVALGGSAGVSQFLVLYIIRCGAVHPSYIFFHIACPAVLLLDHR